MSTLLITICVLALFHFLVEAIILPDFRMAQRFKLQAIKDKAQYDLTDPNLSKDRKEMLLHIVQLADVGIKHMSELNLWIIFKAHQMAKQDAGFQKFQAAHNTIINKAELEDLKNLQSKTGDIMGKVAIYNHVGLLPILVVLGLPLLVLALIIGFIVKKCRNFVRTTKSLILHPGFDKANPHALESIFSLN